LLFCPNCKKYFDDLTGQYCSDCGTHLVQQPISTVYPAVPSSGKAIGSFWSLLSKLSPRTKLVLGIMVVAVVVVAVAASAYHPNPSSPTGVSNLRTRFTHWSEPREGSFSVLLPEGWTAKGGVWRPDSIDWGFWLNATNTGDTMRVFFVLPGYPRYLEPEQAASIFCPTAEGSV
jgi:hypothetical protein